MDNNEAVERLMEIKEEIIELMHEAMTITEQHGSSGTINRARSYWFPHVLMALDENSGYMGRSMCTIEDTAREIETDTDLEGDDSESDADPDGI